MAIVLLRLIMDPNLDNLHNIYQIIFLDTFYAEGILTV